MQYGWNSVRRPQSFSEVEEIRDFVKRDGEVVAEKVGERNWYEFVQSFKAGTGVYNILQRYKRGDPSVVTALNREGVYADICGAPATLGEAKELAETAQASFKRLDTVLQSGKTAREFASLSDKEILEVIRKAVSAAAPKEENRNE